MPEIEPSGLARSPVPKKRPLKKLKNHLILSDTPDPKVDPHRENIRMKPAPSTVTTTQPRNEP